MKLAEALIKRGNLQKRIDALKEKLSRYAKVQEGEKPPEQPDEIYRELKECLDELTVFVQRINKTNSEVMFDEKRSIADVLAYRDVLLQKYKILNKVIESATSLIDRYSKKEIKILSTIDVRAYQKDTDNVAKEYRELDLKVQEKNWHIELI
jgi:hypothetical protein